MAGLTLTPVRTPDSNKLRHAFEVSQDFSVQVSGGTVFVPEAFQFDGASIPAFAWQIIGSPFHPRFLTAAVIHDWLYHTHTIDRTKIKREHADRIFHELLNIDEVNSIKAWLMWKAVRLFGTSYWENDADDLAYLDRLKARIRAIINSADFSKYGL